MSKKFLVEAKSVLHNPTPETLRQVVADMPNAMKTEFGNYNVAIQVTARSKASTYIVDDNAAQHSDQTIDRAEYSKMAALQDTYIENTDIIIIDGFIGPNPETRTPTRLYVEKANANIAAMQQQLYFTPTSSELEHFTPMLNVLYTPNLKAEGYPNDRLIAVDLDNYVTRIFNSDYFGESKKGGLRMWNKLMYETGGLALHAGAKEIPVQGERKIALIIGLSGTGKTTTTFTRQNSSKPLQDDFIAWLPNGAVIGSEAGCFAKTFGLDAKAEPMIHHATTQPEAFLENVKVSAAGKVDFFDESYTQNGRATFPMDLIPEAGDINNIPKVDFVLILNRNQNIIPAVAKLSHAQAAAFFMLGETQGTSAGGTEEAGKALRVPGTNPFFPLLHAQQGKRFYELIQKSSAAVYLMNTGWVGGPEGTAHSRKVKIKHSSAVVQGIAENTIVWQRDTDFGYEVATKVEGIEGADTALLRPAEYYTATERTDEYATLVAELKRARAAHLGSFKGLPEELPEAVS